MSKQILKYRNQYIDYYKVICYDKLKDLDNADNIKKSMGG